MFFDIQRIISLWLNALPVVNISINILKNIESKLFAVVSAKNFPACSISSKTQSEACYLDKCMSQCVICNYNCGSCRPVSASVCCIRCDRWQLCVVVVPAQILQPSAFRSCALWSFQLNKTLSVTGGAREHTDVLFTVCAWTLHKWLLLFVLHCT